MRPLEAVHLLVKLLIIEDDEKIASFLAQGFREAGYVVDVARDGLEGLDLALVREYDVAVVDLMLPGLDGLSLIEKMRSENVRTPVIILSARGSVNDRIRGLETGGDDYVVKPFSFSELHARVQAVIRRSSGGAASAESSLQYDGITLDLIKREVSRDGTFIPLHAREFALLELFLRHPERVLSKAVILENVYDFSFDPQTNVVDVLVHRLRKKIDEDFDEKLIHTVRGMGYVLRRDAS